jgi:sporulation protein YqfD
MDYTAFKIAAEGCQEAISFISAKKILVFDAKIVKNDLYFKVKRNERQKIIALFDEMCYTYTIIGEGGLFFRVSSFLRRKGLVAGILIAAVLLSLVNSRLNEIRINGLKTVEYSAVERVLESEGVKKGIKTASIDKKHLEYVITDSVDGIAFASVKISGMTLIVNIYEELPPPDIVDMTNPLPVAAKKDGVISRIVAFQGTPAVKVGDAVRAGDILIAPYAEVGETRVETRALGEVFAKVCYFGTAAFVENRVVVSRTGRSKGINQIEIFGILIGKRPESPYVMFEETSDVRCLFSPAPLKITRITYYELKAETAVGVFADELQGLIERAKRDAEKSLPKDAVVLDAWYVIRNIGEGNRIVEYYYEAEEKIS